MDRAARAATLGQKYNQPLQNTKRFLCIFLQAIDASMTVLACVTEPELIDARRVIVLPFETRRRTHNLSPTFSMPCPAFECS